MNYRSLKSIACSYSLWLNAITWLNHWILYVYRVLLENLYYFQGLYIKVNKIKHLMRNSMHLRLFAMDLLTKILISWHYIKNSTTMNSRIYSMTRRLQGEDSDKQIKELKSHLFGLLPKNNFCDFMISTRCLKRNSNNYLNVQGDRRQDATTSWTFRNLEEHWPFVSKKY